MKDFLKAFVVWVIGMTIFLYGAYRGSVVAENRMREEACKRGFADWFISEGGEPKFMWKTQAAFTK